MQKNIENCSPSYPGPMLGIQISNLKNRDNCFSSLSKIYRKNRTRKVFTQISLRAWRVVANSGSLAISHETQHWTGVQGLPSNCRTLWPREQNGPCFLFMKFREKCIPPRIFCVFPLQDAGHNCNMKLFKLFCNFRNLKIEKTWKIIRKNIVFFWNLFSKKLSCD